MRGAGQAEFITWPPNNSGILISDAQSGEPLLFTNTGTEGYPVINDYDFDGLDDLLLVTSTGIYTSLVRVYGVATGSAVLPPQELMIQPNSSSFTLSWQPVTGANGYRIEWSSQWDGQYFTRIGFSRMGIFTHSRVDTSQMGFYRVLAQSSDSTYRLIAHSFR
jgi:hypothetical protein